MRSVLGVLFLLTACSSHYRMNRNELPFPQSEVTGTKVMFRQMAMGVSRDQACEKAYRIVLEDIKKTYKRFQKVDHYIEHTAYDHFENECIVTVSVPNPVRPIELSEDEIAEKTALVGVSRSHFEDVMGKVVEIEHDNKNICWREFSQSGHTTYGKTTVCWDKGRVRGYCNAMGCFENYPTIEQ